MDDNLTPQDINPESDSAPEFNALMVEDDLTHTDLVGDEAAEGSAETTELVGAGSSRGRLRSLPWKTIGALSLTTAFGVGGVALLANADHRDPVRSIQASSNLPIAGGQQTGPFGQAGQNGQFGSQPAGPFGQLGQPGQFGGRGHRGHGFGPQQGGQQQGGQQQGGPQQGGFSPGQPGQFPSARSGGS